MRERVMTARQPKPVTGTPATVEPRHRKAFNFPLPVKAITEYRETSVLGKRLPRAGIEQDVQDWLTSAANKALEDAGGVAGVMQKVLGG